MLYREQDRAAHAMLQMPTSTFSERFEDATNDGYPYRDMWINGRNVLLDNILQGKAEARSPFEETTFEFVREWMQGTDRFEMTTSGSTGTPKTIALTRTQMMASAAMTAKKINLRKFSWALVAIDTKYIAGKMMLVRSLTSGLRIMAVDPSANPLIKIPVDKCVQFTAFVPYQVSAILESKHPHLLNNLDTILIGGAPLNETSREELDRFQCACYETYGMTETVSHIALRLINTPMKQPYFETLPGVEVSTDGRGCLVIKAAYLGHPVVTNDLVEITAPGKFLWLGRLDSVINSGGVKVVPEKIEKLLEKIFKRHQLRHRFFIAALPDEKLGSKIVLVLEGVQFSSELLLQSLDELKEAASPYELPKEVHSVAGFHTTETRKIDRKKSLESATLLFSVK